MIIFMMAGWGEEMGSSGEKGQELNDEKKTLEYLLLYADSGRK